MIIANMNKWISGETESFFDPHSTPSTAASVDSKSADERLTVRAAIRKSVPLAIAAVFGTFVSVALVYFIDLTRTPIEPCASSRSDVAVDQRRNTRYGRQAAGIGRGIEANCDVTNRNHFHSRHADPESAHHLAP